MVENRVGHHVPTEAELEALAADIRSVEERIRRWGITLSPEERVGTTKLRNGGEMVVDLVHTLAREYSLTVPGVPLEGMKTDLALYKAARGVEQQLAQVHQLAADTRLEAQSEGWQACMAYYSTLQVMAQRDPALAEKLRPATEFMATGKRRKTELVPG